MSFKYRFILSFVLLEAVFIALIVTMNFIAITDSSEKLISQKIRSNADFLEELVKVPISIYDLATLDNLVQKSVELKHINSIVILDANKNVLSESFNFKHGDMKSLINIKEDKIFQYEDFSYKMNFRELKEDDIALGFIYMIFDTSENSTFIYQVMKNNAFIIVFEIIISTFLSFIIGSRLTNMLVKLSVTAKEIGEYKYPEVPFQDKTDEIGILSKSMAQMLVDLKDRREKLKNLARELKLQKDELVEANKSKDDFLANMSHELKTPLNSINVISSVMMKNKKGQLDDGQVKNLSIINKCGNDLLFLINDVLDISKLEAGEVSLDFETIDFILMMTSIKEMFEPQVKEKNLNFIFELPSSTEAIYSDQNRIKQIIKNLLSNALKFVEKGSIKLIVKDIGDDFHIIVSDDGIGIAQEKLENIFDRFKQADESTTRKFGGTGLGLAICKELSNLLGGDITVESKVDVGTTFTVVLPKNIDKVDKNKKIEEHLVVHTKEEVNHLASSQVTNDPEIDFKAFDENTKSESKPNVLLLNNDPIAFISLAVALKSISHFEQVTNLTELLKHIKVKNYDKIIIDISKLDEEEVKKVITSLDLNLIVVCNDINNVDELIKNKVSNIFEKPIDKDRLLSLVKE